MMKTYKVYFAKTLTDRVQCYQVQAKQRRSAEKIVRQAEGQDIIIDTILQVEDNYTTWLIENNID